MALLPNSNGAKTTHETTGKPNRNISSVLALLFILSTGSVAIQSCGESEASKKERIEKEKEDYSIKIVNKVEDLIKANSPIGIDYVDVIGDLIEFRGNNIDINFSITNCYIFSGDFVAFINGEPHVICRGVNDYFVKVMKQYEAWVKYEEMEPTHESSLFDPKMEEIYKNYKKSQEISPAIQAKLIDLYKEYGRIYDYTPFGSSITYTYDGETFGIKE